MNDTFPVHVSLEPIYEYRRDVRNAILDEQVRIRSNDVFGGSHARGRGPV